MKKVKADLLFVMVNLKNATYKLIIAYLMKLVETIYHYRKKPKITCYYAVHVTGQNLGLANSV